MNESSLTHRLYSQCLRGRCERITINLRPGWTPWWIPGLQNKTLLRTKTTVEWAVEWSTNCRKINSARRSTLDDAVDWEIWRGDLCSIQREIAHQLLSWRGKSSLPDLPPSFTLDTASSLHSLHKPEFPLRNHPFPILSYADDPIPSPRLPDTIFHPCRYCIRPL